MEEIVIYEISPYLNNEDFIKSYSCLCKRECLNMRRLRINQKKSNELFSQYFLYGLPGYHKVMLEEHIHQGPSLFDKEYLTEFLKDIVESLLNETSLERVHLEHHSIKKMVIPKYIMFDFNKFWQICKNTTFQQHKTSPTLFLNNEVGFNINLCPIYRIPMCGKRILCENFPIATALIY